MEPFIQSLREFLEARATWELLVGVGIPVLFNLIIYIVEKVAVSSKKGSVVAVVEAHVIGHERKGSWPDTLPRVLKLVIPSGEEQENIIGDLLEEFNELPPEPGAYFWLFRQALKSSLPLTYKNLKSRLASYFGKRVR